MKKLMLAINIVLFMFSVNVYAALTKTQNTQSQEWVEVAQNTIDESGEIDCSTSYAITLHIDVCLSSTTAHTGTQIIIQIASEATVDDSWTTLQTYCGPTGTAVKTDCNDTSSGMTIYVTDPATGHLDHNGKFVFIEDTATVANSQICFQTANTGDAGDTITVLDTPLTTDTDCDVYTIDGDASAGATAVSMTPVSIPITASRARVICNNQWDADGSSVHWRVRETKTTEL